MKKNIKSLSFILLACFIFISIPFNAKASNVSDETLNFVKEQITSLSDSLEESNWNDSSEIYNVIPLYDLDDIINGYIYEIRTNGDDAGFIQVDISTGENIVSSFAFEGTHAVNKMLEKYQEQTRNININKIVYLGGYSYFIKNNETSIAKSVSGSLNLFDLNSSKYVSEDITNLKSNYNEKVNLKKKSARNYSLADDGISTLSTVVKKYVPNANYDILVEMDDFAGKKIKDWTITNHCSPTAGLNIVKYWALKRGVSQLYYSGDSWMFNSLAVNMKTNINNGTIRDDIYTGLWNYGANTRGVTPSGGDKITSGVTYDKAKTILDSGVPFIVSVDNYGGTIGGHSVACFGYYENVSNYLIINNGWNKSWTFESFNNLNIDRYTYSRWN
ncbi:C39 family peptidase [Clostridium tertium]|uniref:C39 family peptidase n=1 Tax=Clostridium tertium TaxID=1559 RepID=UPI00163D85B8|nr:C39 family peptidase [Clostridium tertium]MDB1943754.1 C39 family peptidase [Clostridium tertium]MDB1951080.1 C39 family peptidase [Clostridium tertium]